MTTAVMWQQDEWKETQGKKLNEAKSDRERDGKKERKKECDMADREEALFMVD